MTPFYYQKIRPFLRDLCADKIDSGITEHFNVETLADDKIDKFLSLMVEGNEETFYRIEDASEMDEKLIIFLRTQESVDKEIFADVVKKTVYKMYKNRMQELLTQEFDSMVMEYEADKKMFYEDEQC